MVVYVLNYIKIFNIGQCDEVNFALFYVYKAWKAQFVLESTVVFKAHNLLSSLVTYS